MKFFFSILIGILLTSNTLAKPKKLINPASTEKKITSTDNWKNSGYIDGSYNYLLHDNQFISGVFDRVYDLNPNGMTLHQASYLLAYQPEGFGSLINPVFGKDTFIFAPYGWDPYLGITQAGFAIPQGYLQYKQNTWVIIGGQFFTLAGTESIDPTKNTNFSRSILTGFAQPFTHLGVRNTYRVNDKLTLVGGVNNGWDSIRDTGRPKTLELSFIYTPSPLFFLAVAYYSGGQHAADRTDYGPISNRKLLDLVATIKATKKLTLIAAYDYGTQPQAALPSDTNGKATWEGFAGYVNYQFNDKWRTSLRGEIFNDFNGYRTGVVQIWKEMTLTIGYNLLKNVELRAETRHDVSNENSFLKKKGQGTSNNQQSYAIEGVITFN